MRQVVHIPSAEEDHTHVEAAHIQFVAMRIVWLTPQRANTPIPEDGSVRIHVDRRDVHDVHDDRDVREYVRDCVYVRMYPLEFQDDMRPSLGRQRHQTKSKSFIKEQLKQIMKFKKNRGIIALLRLTPNSFIVHNN